MATKKMIGLKNSNLFLVGAGHDTNGLQTVKLSFARGRGFSIQTNGNLKETHRFIGSTPIGKLSALELATVEKEAVKYIQQFGTPTQKKKLKTY
jgi:hypothetical protein